jgi:simple sugar transport system ATP-binding protein
MSGRIPGHADYRHKRIRETPSLELESLSREGHFNDVNLRLFPGEIVGLAGLKGAGRAALALSLFGLTPPDSGQLRIDGEDRHIQCVEQAVRLGIALVPEDRALQGLVMSHSVGRNAVLTTLDHVRNRWGLLPPRQMQAAMARTTQSMAVRSESVDVAAENLSGGNQQRLVLAKWLATRPRILILIGPTVGIDIAARSGIHKIVQELAREGMTILMISDDIPELLANCNRVLLMSQGTIAREWETPDVSEAEVRRALLET